MESQASSKPLPEGLSHVEVVRRVLESRLLSAEQLLAATRHSREQQTELCQALLDLQLLTEEQLEQILATSSAAPDAHAINGTAQSISESEPRIVTLEEVDSGFENDVRAQLRGIAASAVPSDLLQQVIFHAYTSRATDVHFDPRPGRYVIRFRVDGQLHDMVELSLETALAVIRGIKITAELDIVERRHPQDGSMVFRAGDQTRSIRVSTLPLSEYEKVALRILEPRSETLVLEQLGFEPSQLEVVSQLLAQPYGAILVGGPVGSGKTTSLYSCLERLNHPSRNLMSIEDPVERQISGVNQAEVDARVGLRFAEGLRAVLRQDPDILMIGEIRDEETAQIGIRAALTGVLVLSTIHASDAASVITSLFNYGIPGHTLASALRGVLSQRLLRKICTHCRTPYKPDSKILHALRLNPDQHQHLELFRGRGCSHCLRTGYHGRIGIYEVMPISELLPDLILRQTTSEVIREVARDEGMKTLRDSAINKVVEGITTVEEMYRVTF